MKRHIVIGGLSLVAALFAAGRPFAAGELDNAKALYAAASYEEALVALDKVDKAADPIQVNQYRALCLLALGRARDAEAPLQQIVSANPLFALTASDVSPRLVDLFKDVRRRMLPATARQLYSKAKASYDGKNYRDASADFKTLLAVLGDPDAQRGEMSDLKDLAEGFLALANAQLGPEKPSSAAAAAPAGVPPPAAAQSAPASTPASAKAPGAKVASGSASTPAVVNAAPGGTSSGASRGEARVYTPADTDVTPPVEIQRTLPPWTPLTTAQQLSTFRGALRLIVDEHGEVEAVTLVTPVFPTYNEPLLRAAKTWRYQPALRQGSPVKYALSLDIVLRPNGPQKE